MTFHWSGSLLAAALIASALPSAAAPITVTDMLDNPVKLEKPAERIASLPIPLASTIIAVDGSTKKLVGMNPLAKSAIEQGILGKIFPEAKAISSAIAGANFIPNVEELAAVRPDLVIRWGDIGNAAIEPLRNANLTTMLVTYGTEARGRQLVLLARALATGADVLILDEPAAALDLHNEKRLLDILRAIRSESGETVTTHNLSRLYGVDMQLVRVKSRQKQQSFVVPSFALCSQCPTARATL